MRLAFGLYFLAAAGFTVGTVLIFPTSFEIQSAVLKPDSTSITISNATLEGIVRGFDEQSGLLTVDAMSPFSRREYIPLLLKMQATTSVSALASDLQKQFPSTGNSLQVGTHIQAQISRGTGPLLAQKIFIWP